MKFSIKELGAHIGGSKKSTNDSVDGFCFSCKSNTNDEEESSSTPCWTIPVAYNVIMRRRTSTLNITKAAQTYETPW